MSMIERVARAICEERGEGWDASNEDERASWRETAVAAIEAMREPTEGMCWLGQTALDEECEPSMMGPAPAPIWRAMIDAALSEGKE